MAVIITRAVNNIAYMNLIALALQTKNRTDRNISNELEKTLQEHSDNRSVLLLSFESSRSTTFGPQEFLEFEA